MQKWAHTIKDRNGMDLPEAEDIKKRCQEYTELYKKELHDLDNHNGVITHLEPDILECEVKYTMEYYSAIKKNTFESVLMRWMKLEPIIQSEVSQKEKHQYSVLMHIYMEFRPMVTITLYMRQRKRHRCIEQSFGLCGRGRGWDDLGEWH